jgi:peroxisome-assembly ATPase
MSSSSSSTSFDKGPLHDRYVKMAHLQDPIQLQALRPLERLRHELLTKKLVSSPSRANANTTATSSWSGWMTMSASSASQQQQAQKQHVLPPPAIRGVYLHGGVGCGKTFLMNHIFHDSMAADSSLSNGWHFRKTHFHKFMLHVHQEMHQARKRNNMTSSGSSTGNIQHADALIDAVVDSIAGGGGTTTPTTPNTSPPPSLRGTVLCFDEFQVTDVADALILQRLFTALWRNHCIVVATSNRPPDDLYLNGLQRDRFLPFIADLKVHCEVVSMWESANDYRLILKEMDNNDNKKNGQLDGQPQQGDKINGSNQPAMSSSPQVYFQGPDRTAYKDFDALFYQMVGPNTAIAPTSLSIQGRRVNIPQAALVKGVARFTFADLCQKALGAADYLIIGQNFDTVFVQDIPALNLAHINWARRFITFIDAMYESHCKVILHAATPPERIFHDDSSSAGSSSTTTAQHDEVFAFARTVSRLHEMSSQSYLQRQQRRRPELESKASLLSQGKAVVNVHPSLGDSVLRG